MDPVVLCLQLSLLLLASSILTYAVTHGSDASERLRGLGVALFGLALTCAAVSMGLAGLAARGRSTAGATLVVLAIGLGFAFWGEYWFRRSQGHPGFVNRSPDPPEGP